MYVSGLIYFFDLMGAKPADFIKYPTINLPSFKKIPPAVENLPILYRYTAKYCKTCHIFDDHAIYIHDKI